uniref:Cytochrome c oxidase subunit Vb n=1 Tax=Timema bartmani TaxID=61472 RepID=A0A7R9F1A8_9NEOP|nr:unnamed protein product [Timema bartmani]
MPDPMELATGLEKRELLARAAVSIVTIPSSILTTSTIPRNIILKICGCYAHLFLAKVISGAGGISGFHQGQNLADRHLEFISKVLWHPFDQKLFKRGPGTKDSPNLIPSAFQARMVGCICEPEATHINWMWLHKGYPKRCSCGHWFQLEEKAPL